MATKHGLRPDVSSFWEVGYRTPADDGAKASVTCLVVGSTHTNQYSGKFSVAVQTFEEAAFIKHGLSGLDIPEGYHGSRWLASVAAEALDGVPSITTRAGHLIQEACREITRINSVLGAVCNAKKHYCRLSDDAVADWIYLTPCYGVLLIPYGQYQELSDYAVELPSYLTEGTLGKYMNSHVAIDLMKAKAHVFELSRRQELTTRDEKAIQAFLKVNAPEWALHELPLMSAEGIDRHLANIKAIEEALPPKPEAVELPPVPMWGGLRMPLR